MWENPDMLRETRQLKENESYWLLFCMRIISVYIMTLSREIVTYISAHYVFETTPLGC
jgi:hypothetical protein